MFITLLYLLLLCILLPLFFVISVAIFVTSRTPIFYKQKRVGEGGKIFELLKFRTMHTNADNVKSKLTKLNEASGPVFKIYDDPRFTPIGKFLSHTGLDELPQLINIVKGDMNLMGPRPLPVEEAKKLADWQLKRHHIKPGIISPWIVDSYHSTSFDAWMKSDIQYIKNKNLLYDSILLLKAGKFFIRLVGRELMYIFG